MLTSRKFFPGIIVKNGEHFGNGRSMGLSPASVPESFQRVSGKSFDAPAGAYHFSCRKLNAQTTARIGTYRPMGRSHFSFDGERKVCKRKPAARRLQRRPTSLCTAAKPCAALGLGYALHGFQPFLALVGLRPPLAVGFGLREPNGWMPRINSGHPIPALRPEQSDHVPWADSLRGCPRARGVRCRIAPYRSLCSPPTLPAGRFGLRPRPHWDHASLRDSSLRSPAGKKASIAHFGGGARNVARNGVGQRSPTSGARSCSPFSAVKMGGPFSLRCLSPLCSAAAGTEQTQMALLGMSRCGLRGFAAQKNGLDFFFAAGTIHTQITSLGMRRYKLNIFVTQKASMDSYPRWPF